MDKYKKIIHFSLTSCVTEDGFDVNVMWNKCNLLTWGFYGAYSDMNID